MNLNLEDTAYRSDRDALRGIVLGHGKKALVMTFGCQQNEADGEHIRGVLEDAGYAMTDRAEDADVIILNTCAVREHAQAKVLSMIGRFKALKKNKSDLVIGVCGCMAAEKGAVEMLKNDFHYVSFTLQPGCIQLIPSLIFKALTDKKRSFVFGDQKPDIVEDIPRLRSQSASAWVSVMYGCNNFCSYCIVPFARGRERSRCSEKIIAECRRYVAEGVKEITLLGQNVNSYSSDMDFPSLLRAVCDIEGDFIVRFMTSHPKDVSDELIRVIAESQGKIAPAFHLPLQSGSDRILKLMNRTYDSERFFSILQKLRESIPGIAVTSDIIVGFPTETEDDFEKTLDAVRRAQFDAAYCFVYSKRAGTVAARMQDQVPDEIKSERIQKLIALQNDVSVRKNEELVGTVQKALVDSVSKKDAGVYTARTDTNKTVHFVSDENLVGKRVFVEIEKACATTLYGKLFKKI